MNAWQLLVSTDYGLLSLAVILFVIVMGGGMSWYFFKHSHDQP